MAVVTWRMGAARAAACPLGMAGPGLVAEGALLVETLELFKIKCSDKLKICLFMK